MYTHHREILQKAEAKKKELDSDMSQIKKFETREESRIHAHSQTNTNTYLHMHIYT